MMSKTYSLFYSELILFHDTGSHQAKNTNEANYCFTPLEIYFYVNSRVLD